MALAILSVAAAGSARMFSLAVVANGRARAQTLTTMLAMQKLEELRALSWCVRPGPPAVPESDTSTDLAQSSPASGVTGLGTSPAGSLDRNMPGYVDYLDRTGAWVGTGTTPPSAALFVRRWSVAGLPGDDFNTLVLQVRVMSVAADVARAAVGSHPRLPGDTSLAVVRTRVSR